MLFTPKKRQGLVLAQHGGLFGFSFVFGIGAIGVLFSPNNGLSGRIVTALIFILAALATWALGRRC